MIGNNLFGKLFVIDRYFTIALRKKKAGILSGRNKFIPDFIVPANRGKWVADPMLIDANGKTYLFYEAVLEDKGHIEVTEVRGDCTVGEPQIILQDECHYSYPFVFYYRGEWYMIPESSAAGEVRLYKSVHFPEKWTMQSVLLYEKAVDTTIFEQTGHLYLTTFFLTEKSERVIPHAYELELSDDNACLREIKWESYDELRVRGAGPFIITDHELIRPAQISQEQRYGDGVVFYRASIGEQYNEKSICEIKAIDLKVRGYYVDGLHTYSSSEKFEAIDIRCGVVNVLKPIFKLFRKTLSMGKKIG